MAGNLWHYLRGVRSCSNLNALLSFFMYVSMLSLFVSFCAGFTVGRLY